MREFQVEEVSRRDGRHCIAIDMNNALIQIELRE